MTSGWEAEGSWAPCPVRPEQSSPIEMAPPGLLGGLFCKFHCPLPPLT